MLHFSRNVQYISDSQFKMRDSSGGPQERIENDSNEEVIGCL